MKHGLEAIDWCGGTYSSEWGFSKVLHWLRQNPDLRSHFVTALENCDMVTATLCGIRNTANLSRSVCATGHKWMYGERWGGLPSQKFLSSIDPLSESIREKLGGSFRTSDKVAGFLAPDWAERLQLRAGIPIPIGALDAHWDALAANLQLYDMPTIRPSDDKGAFPGSCKGTATLKKRVKGTDRPVYRFVFACN